MRPTVLIVLACCGFAGARAAADGPAVYSQGPYSAPMVSPYLNLGVTQNGLSNYQTLVRPMIEDREALLAQSTNIQKLQLQLRNAQRNAAGEAKGEDKPRPGAVRFMHYSHYFNRLP